MLHAKFGANRSNCLRGVLKSTFFICPDFVKEKLQRKWVWPTPHNTAQLREHVDLTFNNVQHIMWELWAFAFKMARPAGHFWCLSHGGHSIAPL